MKKLSIIIALLLFGFILWAISIANSGGHSVFFSIIREIPYGDKLGHFILFGSLAFIGIIASGFHSIRVLHFRIYSAALLVAVFATAEEFSQYFIPTRTFDLVDLSADAIGIALFSLLAYTIRRILQLNSKKPINSS